MSKLLKIALRIIGVLIIVFSIFMFETTVSWHLNNNLSYVRSPGIGYLIPSVFQLLMGLALGLLCLFADYNINPLDKH